MSESDSQNSKNHWNHWGELRLLACFIATVNVASVSGQVFDFHSVRGREVTGGLIEIHEGESDFSISGTSRVQAMNHYGPQWSGNAHLLWHGKVGDELKTDFLVNSTGVYDITLQFTQAVDYGIFELTLEGAKSQTGENNSVAAADQDLKLSVDLFSQNVSLSKPVRLRKVHLHSGPQVLRMKLTGSHPNAKQYRDQEYLLGFDYLRLEREQTELELENNKNATPRPESVSRPVSEKPDKTTNASIDRLLQTFCLDCHRGKDTDSGIDLEVLGNHEGKIGNIQLVRKVRDTLRRYEMPPEDEPQPTPGERLQLEESFQSIIKQYLTENPDTAPVVMRRMNRFEYNNAIRELLEMSGDIYPLPEKTIRSGQPYFDPASGRFPRSITVGNRTLGKNQVERQILTGVSPFAIDLQAEGGFNNRGDELSISPILLESFITLGRSIVDAPEFDDYCGLTDTFFSPPGGQDLNQQTPLIKRRLAEFLEKAFRSSIDPETLNRYHNYFLSRLKSTSSYRQAMKDLVAAVLASPRFIFLAEHSHGQNETVPLSAYELATRLSFFLWSSIPDDELLSVARNGSLLDQDVLRSQTVRMLEDPRCQAISQNFARQWLRLDYLVTAVPDFERFPEYYSRIGCEQWKFGLQTMIEPLLLFESIMVEDRSLMLLIDSNYTYRSQELQTWYDDKVPFESKENRNRFNTNMQAFTKRPLTDRRQGGVLTSAATLTMTSAPLRTSPITRGAWVATVLLNQPPPPPPDVVPTIEADERDIEAQGLTLRQRLKQHQADAACVSCHSKIDPLGFALENYDAVGRWRDQYSTGLAIDASGKLRGSLPFKNITELKDQLLVHPEIFLQAFSEHLLSYAIGRPLVLEDDPVIDSITQQAVDHQGQFTKVVHAVVQSPTFRLQHTETTLEGSK
ncbi:DUF1588 domain-containing protein [bacterium]|nr:DUF1588 domain-containing protein [Rhodopirellula sp.]MDB4678734.1 DUF1588 domain-containing protein [Rhodopirellula sp.]MDC0278888.1 DUF1588 domain-containing protein [bacterium]MDC0295432.1 DUF1588 domain-containing protein [bacterium]